MSAFDNQRFSHAWDDDSSKPGKHRRRGGLSANADKHLRWELSMPKIDRDPIEKRIFYAKNAVILPIAALIYAYVSAEGLRVLAPVMATKAYKLPIPGFGLWETQDGWNRLELSHITAVCLFALLLSVWSWVVMHVHNAGESWYERVARPVAFYFQAVLASVLIVIELVVFYFGLNEMGTGAWGDGSSIAVGGIAGFYVFAMAWIAQSHVKFHYGV